MAKEDRRRLELRCSSEQREMIDRAVSLTGRSMTDFVLDAVQEAVVKTIREYESIRLNRKESAALAEALLNPIEPGSKLRAAAKRYKAASR